MYQRNLPQKSTDYLSRRFTENQNHKHCWTSFGRVLLRKIKSDRYIVINSKADLDNLHQDFNY